MARSVFCMATSYAQAESIVNELRGSGFANTAISVLFPDKRGDHDFVHVSHRKAPEGAIVGMTVGWIAAGALGLLAAMGSISFPGADSLRVAGDVFASLSCAAVGAAVGGVIGVLLGLRGRAYEARRYAGKVDNGSILLSVHAGDAAEAQRAETICKNSGAVDVGCSREAHLKAQPADDARS